MRPCAAASENQWQQRRQSQQQRQIAGHEPHLTC
jgi:hypothetical protein